MTTERKLEPTRTLPAKDAAGSPVEVQERRQFIRERFSEGWSEWVPADRTFWIGTTRLGVIDPCTLRTPAGALLTLEPPGIA